jgi:hypothetical protein
VDSLMQKKSFGKDFFLPLRFANSLFGIYKFTIVLISAIIGLSNLAFEKKQYRVIEGLGAALNLIGYLLSGLLCSY